MQLTLTRYNDTEHQVIDWAPGVLAGDAQALASIRQAVATAKREGGLHASPIGTFYPLHDPLSSASEFAVVLDHCGYRVPAELIDHYPKAESEPSDLELIH